MKNSKWVKIAPKEEILKLKGQESFIFTIPNLCNYFNIPDRRMGELLKYYQIDVIKLSKNKKLSKEEWVSICETVHGKHFDYSVSEYRKGNSLINIGCPVHGIIEVNANSHKNGGGCRKCNAKENSPFKSLDKEDFIKDALITHNSYYDYSKVEDFNDTHEQVTIICPIHGEFKQKIYSHRYGSGCEKCSYVERGLNKRVSLEDFIKRAIEKHGNIYNYSKTTFSKIDENITIICPHHGEFTQIAKNHLNGGCLSCGKIYSAYSFKKDDNYIEVSKTLPSGLYILKFKDFYKIGISNDIHSRITLIKSRACIDYRPEIILYKEISLFDAVKHENILHNKYKYLSYTPNFNFEGQTECFNLDLPIKEIITYLKSAQ